MSMDEEPVQRSAAEASSSTDEGDAEDPYAWAKSMKNVQEEVGLCLSVFDLMPGGETIASSDVA